MNRTKIKFNILKLMEYKEVYRGIFINFKTYQKRRNFSNQQFNKFPWNQKKNTKIYPKREKGRNSKLIKL